MNFSVPNHHGIWEGKGVAIAEWTNWAKQPLSMAPMKCISRNSASFWSTGSTKQGMINPFESLITKKFEQSNYWASDNGSLLNTPTKVNPVFTLQLEKRTLVAHHIEWFSVCSWHQIFCLQWLLNLECSNSLESYYPPLFTYWVSSALEDYCIHNRLPRIAKC